jgi:hypothetical protein
MSVRDRREAVHGSTGRAAIRTPGKGFFRQRASRAGSKGKHLQDPPLIRRPRLMRFSQDAFDVRVLPASAFPGGEHAKK